MRVTAERIVEEYDDALRRGAPLEAHVVDGSSTVTFGLSESLFGAETVHRALREQTRNTDNWTVQRRRLTVEERRDVAWFGDEVALEWTDREDGTSHSFDTKWSGTLLAAVAESPTPAATETGPTRDRNAAEGLAGTAADDREPAWLFATMHVSAPKGF